MRLLKAMMAMVAGSAVALGGASVPTHAQQPPPARKSAPGPAKQAPVPAKQTPGPSKQAVPAKQSPAPARSATAPTATKATGVKTTAAPASTSEAVSASAAQAGASPDMSPGKRRDPFAELISNKQGKQRLAPEVTCRAPGKGGVAIDTMQVDGLVRSGDGMIAAVRTPQGRVYFLREGDRLCDGRVEHITMEGITLRQSSRDAFGRGLDRPVNKRLFPSAGEQR